MTNNLISSNQFLVHNALRAAHNFQLTSSLISKQLAFRSSFLTGVESNS